MGKTPYPLLFSYWREFFFRQQGLQLIPFFFILFSFLLLSPSAVFAGESNLRTGGKLTLSKATVPDGQSVEVTVPVWNNGPDETRTSPTGSPRSFYLYVYLSRQPGDLNGSSRLGSVTVSSLKAGAKVNVKMRVKIPSRWPIGTSYIHAYVDAYGNYVRNESDESDNFSFVYNHSVPISIIHLRSNLRTAGKLTASKTTNLVETESFNVDVPIWNNGNAPTLNNVGGTLTSHRLDIYISKEPGSLVRGKLLGSLWVNSLAANAKQTARLNNLKIPVGWPVGTSYIHAVLDAYGNRVRNEFDENDNYSYTYGHSLAITVGRSRSNLKVASVLTVSTKTPAEGETLTINVPVENNGTAETLSSVGGSSTSFRVAVYLSPRPGSTASSVLLGTTWVNSLPAGKKAIASITTKVPVNTKSGKWYIHAFVDDYHNRVRNESNEGDNYSYAYGYSTTISVTRARSNLRTASTMTVSKTSLIPAESATFMINIINDGNRKTLSSVNGSAQSFYVDFYIAPYPGSLTGATHLGRSYVTALNPGQKRLVALIAKIPTNWPRGKAYIHAVVDGYRNYVRNENDESDNASYWYGHSTTVTILNDSTPAHSAWADLQTSAPISTSRSILSEGSIFTISVPVKNGGNTETFNALKNGIATNFNVTFYLSRFSNTLDGAVSLGKVTLPTTKPGDIHKALLHTKIPKGWPDGVSYIHALVDSDNHVKNELSRSNNRSFFLKHSKQVTISHSFSNLIVGAAMTPCQKKIGVGQQICVTVPIYNDGPAMTSGDFTGSPASYVVRLYISQFPDSLMDAQKLSDTTMAALSAGGRLAPKFYVTIPPTWPAGKAYIHAVLDVTNTVKNESNEQDNVSSLLGRSAPIEVLRSFSNLKTAGKISTLKPTYEVGELVNLSLKITNAGSEATLSDVGGLKSRFSVRFYLTPYPNGLIEGSDLGTLTVDPLNGGASTTIHYAFKVPSSWHEGTAYIHALVDSQNNIKNESNEGDNLSYLFSHSTSIKVTRSYSNLVTAAPLTTTNAAPKQGTLIKVTVTLKNTGTVETLSGFAGLPAGSRVDLYLSKRPHSLFGAAKLGSTDIASLKANHLQKAEFTALIPSNFPAGTAYLHALLDAGNAVKNESNEGDNYSYILGHSRKITVVASTTPPQTNGNSNLKLRSTIQLTETTVGDGEYLQLSVPIENAGPYITANKVSGSPRSFYVRVYLSRVANSLKGASSLAMKSVSALPAHSSADIVFRVKIPTNWVKGTSYIHAFVDAYGNYVRNESNENDNISYQTNHSATVKIIHRRSNLTTNATIKLSQSTALDGDSLTAQISITNGGDDWTRSGIASTIRGYYVELYITQLAGSLTGAKSLGRVYTNALKPGGVVVVEIPFKVPTSWPTGPSYIHAFIDSYGNYIRNEFDENDNYSYFRKHSAILTVNSRRSNLRCAGKISLSQSSVFDGEYVIINVPIINNGNETTLNGIGGSPSSNYVYFYLTKDGGSLSGARTLGSVYVHPLKSGEKYTATLRAAIPSGWATGKSYIHAYVDAYRNYVRNESDENDNISYATGHSATIEIKRRRSNLRTDGSLILSHKSRNDGEYFTVTVPVINSGTESTKSGFYVDVYLAPRAGDLTGATHLGRTYVNALKAGQRTQVQLNLRVPINTMPSTWYVHAVVDGYRNYVRNESDETDNPSYANGHSALLKTQQIRSNLRTYRPVTSSVTTYKARDPISVKLSVVNTGNATTLSAVAGTPRTFRVGVYLSRHPASLSGAAFLGYADWLSPVGQAVQWVKALKPMESANLEFTGRIPSNWTAGGPAYIHVYVDSYNNYVRNESDESDNVSYAYGHSLKITLKGSTGTPPTWSNLKGAAQIQSDKARLFEGDTMTLSYFIVNSGKDATRNKLNGSPANFRVRFYISRRPKDLLGAVSLGDAFVHAMNAGAYETAVLQAALPSGWPAGPAYIHAVIDSANNVGNESVRSDNSSIFTSHSLQIFVGARSSNLLTKEKISLSKTTVELGDKVTVGISVLNNGDDVTREQYSGRARAFNVDIYLSQSSNSLLSAVKVGTLTFAALQAGESRKLYLDVTIPANWTGQKVYVHAVLDSSNAIKNESNEGDNNSWHYNHSATLSISLNRSELQTYKVMTVSKAKPFLNDPVTVSIFIENAGKALPLDKLGGTPVRSKVYLYLGRHPAGLQESQRVGEAWLDPLAPGAKTTLTITFRVPVSSAAGTYYLHAFVDATRLVKNESNTGNNFSYIRSHSTSIQIQKDFSNLRTAGLVTSSNVKPPAGSFIRVTVPIINDGVKETLTNHNGNPTSSIATLWISNWPSGTAGARKIGSFTVDSLASKATQTAQFWSQIPSDWPVGDAYLHVRVDDSNTVKNESNEGDNWSYILKHSLKIQVQAPTSPPNNGGTSNLRFADTIKSNKVAPVDGERVTFTLDIYNAGKAVTADKVGGKARSFYVRLYISKATGTLSGATQLASIVVQPLAGGKHVILPVQATIPTGWKGSAYIHAFVDAYANYIRNESREDDNISYQTNHSLQLNIAQKRSNLRIATKIAPSKNSLVAGDYFDVDVVVENSGPVATLNAVGGHQQGFYLDLYLSQQPQTLSGATSLGRVYLQPLKAGERFTQHYQVRIPTNWKTGTSYLHAFVDSYRNYVRNESREDDNISYQTNHSATISVGLRRSNLRVGDPMRVDRTVVPDYGYLNVFIPVWNNGSDDTRNGIAGSTTGFYVDLYLSTNGSTTVGATHLGRVYVPSLAAGAKRTAVLRVRIPANWQKGISYIHALVDGYRNYVRNESNENDNYSYNYGYSAKITVEHLRSNLNTYAMIYLSNNTPNGGDYIDVNVPVENSGDRETLNAIEGAPTRFRVDIYIGPNPTSLQYAQSIGSIWLKSLKAKERTIAQVLVRIPTNYRQGTYFIHALLDNYRNYVRNESDENDNASYLSAHSATVMIGQPRSNLRTDNKILLSRDQVKAGEKIDVTVSIINAGSDMTRSGIGTAAAKVGYRLALYIGKDATSLSGATRVFLSNAYSPMPSGARETKKISITVPSGLKGNYWVHAFLDPPTQLVKNESLRLDNYSYTLGHSAPLGIDQLRSNLITDTTIQPNKTSFSEGSDVTVTVKVRNDDNDTTRTAVNGTPTGFDVWIYISSSPTSLASAALVGKASYSQALAAHAVATVTIKGKLPPGWSGMRYLHAVLNPLDGGKRKVGNERSLNDNTSGSRGHSAQILISKERSDLTFGGKILLSKSQAAPGMSVTATIKLRNDGLQITRKSPGGPPQDVVVNLYLTTNQFGRQKAHFLGAFSTKAPLGAGKSTTLQATFKVPVVSDPEYYVHAYIIPAGNEDALLNNESFRTGDSATLKILATSVSELEFESKLAPSTFVPYAGQVMSVDVPIKNSGKDATKTSFQGKPTGFDVVVYLAPNKEDLKGASIIGRATVAKAMAASSNQIVRVNVTIPASQKPGLVYLHAVIDPNHKVGNEADTSNNNSATAGFGVQINVSSSTQKSRSELQFDTPLWVSTNAPYLGQTISVNVPLKNVGNDQTRDAIAGNPTGFKVNIYISDSKTSIANGQQIGTATVKNAMKPNDTFGAFASATIPNNLKAGTWYIHAHIDAAGQVKNEGNRANNTSWMTSKFATIVIVAKQQHADLYIKGAILPSATNLSPSQSLLLRFTVANKGNDATRDKVGGKVIPFSIEAYIGPTADGAQRVKIGQYMTTGHLSDGKEVVVNLKAKIPASWKAGQAYLHVVIDSSRAVGNEADFNNNESFQTNQSVAVQITTSNKLRSNLRLARIPTVSGSTYLGSWVDVSGSIQNDGTDETRDKIGGNKANFEVNLYISPSGTSIKKAVLWKTLTFNSLASQQSNTFKEHLRIPTQLTVGRHWLVVYIDEKGQVGNESNRLDNLDYSKVVELNIGDFADKDGDGSKSDKDCDDNDKNVNPSAKEVCDGKDNDCDGQIDVGQNLCPAGEVCTKGRCVGPCNPPCGNGFKCVNNQCVEDNCYTTGCKNGEICKKGVCVADACQNVSCPQGEFCREGKCVKSCAGVSCKDSEVCIDGKCQANPCYGIVCKPGEFCEAGKCEVDKCRNVVCGPGRICDKMFGKCVDDLCAHITCPSGEVCHRGQCVSSSCGGTTCKKGERCSNGYCVPDNCYYNGCPTDQICKEGVCVQDRCKGVTCKQGEFCRDGQCTKSCANVTCKTGEICKDGQCQPDKCASVTCQKDEVCVAGTCIKDKCKGVQCGMNRVCDPNTGQCLDDPCLSVKCPSGQVCRGGTCYASSCQQSCADGKVCHNGACVPNNCYYLGCPDGLTCIQGYCLKDACQGVTCQADEYCLRGNCVTSCAKVTCNKGEICREGKCYPDACASVTCNKGEICIDGNCKADPCAAISCPKGQVCDVKAGGCVDDICRHITCPSKSEYCKNGSCYAYKCDPACPKGFICYKDVCREDNCYSYGCEKGKVCVKAKCVDDPCDGVSCAKGEYCKAGQCVKSCNGVSCASGEICKEGQCQQDPCSQVTCKQDEFCKAGKCLPNKCVGISCGAGRICDKETGNCIDDPCAHITCPKGDVCREGSCYASTCQPPCPDGKRCVKNTCVNDDCYLNGCPSDQICLQSVCVADLCKNKQCASDEFCRLGKCVKSCAGVTCQDDEVCRAGQCEKDPCHGVQCQSGEFCKAGKCLTDQCSSVKCAKGQICDKETGHCIDDPCAHITCPGKDQSCRDGECYDNICNPPCKSGEKCKAGKCVEDNCYTNGCKDGEICKNAQCVKDECKDKTCASREFCRDGKCIPSCADASCKSDERCVDGKCVQDKCAGVTCNGDEFCKDGSCLPDLCLKNSVTCGKNRICDKETGKCVDDPCAYVTCPSDEICKQGDCFARPKPEEETTSESQEEATNPEGEFPNADSSQETVNADAGEANPDGIILDKEIGHRGDADDNADYKVAGGCGCSTPSRAPSPFWLLLLFPFFFRRRSSREE